MLEKEEQMVDWLAFVARSIAEDESFSDPFYANETVQQQLAEALTQVFHECTKERVRAFIDSQWAILVRLIHYVQFLQSVDYPEEGLQPLHEGKLMLTGIYKLAVIRYMKQYQKKPEVATAVERSPGFIRYLQTECGLEFVMHFIGFSLRAFFDEYFPEEDIRRGDAQFFQEQMEELLEIVLEWSNGQDVLDTLDKQRDEVVWLDEEVELKKQELVAEPENERLNDEWQQLEEDLLIESLQHHYLQAIIEPIY